MRPVPTRATRRFAVAATAAGILGAVALPGAPAGLGLLLVAVAIAAAAQTLQALPVRGPHALLAALALLLAAAAMLRDADWLVALDAGAAACLASLAASRRRSAQGVLRGSFALIARLPAAPAFAAWSTGVRLRPGAARVALPAARGVILAGALSLVFGGLFASADAAFAQLTGEVLSPDVDLGLLPARLAAFAGVVAVAGGLVTVALAGPAQAASAGGARTGRRAEWVTALVVLDLLFAAFVAVQLAVLFGGHDHVLTTAGLTYAEYAREGFVQLLLAALLTLGVLAAAWPHARTQRDGRDALELLLSLLCVLTLVVLVSALRRLGLYEDAFGFTVARLSGHAAILWIGGVLMLVMAATLLRRTDWLPLAVAGLTAAGLAAFTLVNPEAVVAERNVERFRERGKIDVPYLRGLSADATPALLELPRRQASCAVAGQAESLGERDGFFGFNVARARARRVLERLPDRSRRAAC